MFYSQWKCTKKNIQIQMFELSWFGENYLRILISGGAVIVLALIDMIFPASRTDIEPLFFIGIFLAWIIFTVKSWFDFGKLAQKTIDDIPVGEKEISFEWDEKGCTVIGQMEQGKNKTYYPWTSMIGYGMSRNFMILLVKDPKIKLVPIYLGSIDRNQFVHYLKDHGVNRQRRLFILQETIKANRERKNP